MIDTTIALVVLQMTGPTRALEIAKQRPEEER
jgi:hypothetical protein